MIDCAANEGHFLDHLAPVAAELADRGLLGTVWVSGDIDDPVGAYPDLPISVATPQPDPATPTVVAAISDFNSARRRRRPTILMEHGAGQSYSDRNSSYVGGSGRESALGVLVPAQRCVDRHRRYYPTGPPVAAIGSPRVDVLRRRHPQPPGNTPPLVCVSWHWSPKANPPEIGSAFDAMGHQILDQLLRLQRHGWIRVAGHHHPRAPEVRQLYDKLAVPVIDGFDEVCEQADIYMVDNSSTLYEFAALDRPVIVVNAPTYRRRISHGLRFWDAAAVGPNVYRPRDVAWAVSAAIEDGPSRQKARHEAVAIAYGALNGDSAARAADWIEKWTT